MRVYVGVGLACAGVCGGGVSLCGWVYVGVGVCGGGVSLCGCGGGCIS